MNAQRQPIQSEIDELTADLWNGRISEERFTDCATEAGVTVGEIDAILEEIRADDGVPT